MFRRIIATLALLAGTSVSHGQEPPPVYGELMQGFPPADEQRVTHSNFMSTPYNRWAFMNVRSLHPSREVYRGNGPVTNLPEASVDLNALEFKLLGDRSVTLQQWLDYSMADSFLVLHEGKVIYEFYASGMVSHRQHAMFSVTKSIVGTLALVLMDEGLIEADRTMVSYIPELAGSAFADSTVQEVLDMTTSVHFSEAYNDPDAEIWQYASVFGVGPAEARAFDSVFDYLITTEKSDYPHGEGFVYVTPKTDVLGWLISRVTGKRLAELVEGRLWQPMGMERDAYFWLDGMAGDWAGGGFNSTARDAARIGQMILQDGRYNGHQIIPVSVAKRILTPGNSALFTRFHHDDPWYSEIGHSYHDQWWSFNNAHEGVGAIGVHGQFIYMDPVANMVIVKQSSHPEEESDANETDGPLIWQQIAEFLMARGEASVASKEPR